MTPQTSPSTKTKVEFPGSSGPLVGYVERPIGEARAWVLFAHCFTCSKDLKSVRRLTAALVERGLGVLRFDFTGLGESEGDFADTNFSSNLEDLRAAADFLRREYEAPELLVGHSLGGAAVIAVAPDLPEVKAVATIGAPSEPGHLRKTVLKDANPRAEESEVEIAGRSFRVKRQLLDDLSEHRLLDSLSRLGRALLIMHAPFDEVVGIDHARRLFDAARHPKSFVALDGADHLLLRDPEDARFAAEILASWSARYVGQEREASGSDRPPAGVVEVAGGADGYTNRIRTAAHDLVADEPASVGGNDLGPNPYELLLAGLGACISMTLRMYADRKKIPLDEVRVRLRHGRIHAEDCETCETQSGRIDHIEKQIEIVGDALTHEQRARLLEISERCPVHRTLTTETVVAMVDALR